MTIGGIALIMCVLMGVFGSGAAFSAGEVGGGFICLMFLIPPIVVLCSTIAKSRIESRAVINIPAHWPEDSYYEGYKKGLSYKNKKPIKSEALTFYKECKAHSINDIDSEAGMAKAKLLYAQKKGKTADRDTIRDLYRTGADEDYINTEVYAKENADAGETYNGRVKDLAEYEVSMKYYGLYKTAKREAEINDLIRKLSEDKKSAERKAQATGMLLKKETSWATMGGIANGIAGPGAGIATALAVEKENAEVRAYNESIMPAVVMLRSQNNDDAASCERAIRACEADKKELSTILIADDSPEKVFSNLIIKDVSHTVRKTGSVEVAANFLVNPDYRIFQTIEPRIDGSIVAELYEDGVKAGSAYFVLPMGGVGNKYEAKLNAYCTKTVNANAKYKIEFKPGQLWAMEK